MANTPTNLTASAAIAGTDNAGRVVRSRGAELLPVWAWMMRAVSMFEQRGFVGRSFLSIVDQAVVSGTSFLTAVIVGRASAPDELGRYYMVLTVIMVLIGLQESLVAAPYMVFGARRRGRDLAEYTGSMWVQHFVLTVLGSVAVMIMAVLLPRTGASGLAPSLWVLVAVAPLILFREGVRRLAFARLRVGAALAIDVTVCLLQLGSLVTLWQLGRLSVPSIFAVMGAASLLACAGWLFTRPGKLFLRWDRLILDWKDNWKFSRWTVLSFLTVDTIPFMMPWILGFAAGEAATGVYGGCATLLGVTNILVHGAGNFMRPQAAHDFATAGIPALRRVLLITGSVFAGTFGVLSLWFLVTGDLLSVFVFGGDFAGTGPLLVVLSLNVLVGSAGYVAGSGLWAIGQPRAGLIADACMLAVTLGLATYLVEPYGPVGAAISAVVGTMVGTALKIFTVIRAMGLIQLDGSPAARGVVV